MGDTHLTRELLEAVFSGERTSADLIPIVLGHLFGLCPKCLHAFEDWRDDDLVSSAFSHQDFSANAIEHASSAISDIKQEEANAQEFSASLLSKPLDERYELLKRAPEELKGPALASRLIDAALGALPGNPQASLAHAKLARTVLQHADLSPFVCELYARAVAYIGNAHRVLGDLPQAAEVMAHSRFILRQQGGGDFLVKSELDKLEGYLRLYQRDYSEAERLLKRAVQGFRTVGSDRNAILATMNLAIVYRHSGETQKAIEIHCKLNRDIESSAEKQIQFLNFHNLAGVLCDAGRHDEAEAWHARTLPFLDGSNTMALLRSEWLQGSIAYGKQELDRAESHFLAARHGFAKFEMDFETALISLELACVYLDQGKATEVKSLATEMVAIFEKQGRHQESLAAALLFQAGAELERVSIDFVQELAAYLRRSSLDPSYKFRSTTS